MNDVDSVADVIAVACLLLGAFFCLTAGIGLVRFPDVLSRMHAGTKPQVVGVLLVMVGSAIRLTGSAVVWMLLLVAAFQLLTAPVSAHLISRIAYRRRHVRRDRLLVDELGGGGRLDEPGDLRGAGPAEDDSPADGGALADGCRDEDSPADDSPADGVERTGR